MKKITEGYVTQTFEDGVCVSQEFTAGNATFEDENGEIIYNGEQIGEMTFFADEFPYMPFDMVQPKDMDKEVLENTRKLM
jgi:hypothetical protein